MKLKIELDSRKYEGEVEEIIEAEEPLLLQAHNEPEVFVILDNVKHWLQNPETAEALNYDIYKRKQEPLVELNWYKTGDTLNTTTKPTKRARDIYYPSVNAWRPNSKGIFTLASGIPTVSEFNYMGVDLIIPYKTLEQPLVNFSNDGGEILFMQTARDETKYNIAGYCVEDEPENRPGSRPLPLLWEWYDKLRENTNKPVGCVFMAVTMNPECADYTKYKEFIDAMDFLVLTYYPWDDRNSDLSDSAVLARLGEIAGWVKNCGKPVIIAGQATYGSHHLLEPKIKMQSDFWRGKGYGIIWYVWNGQETGIQVKFKDDIKNNG